MSKWVHLAGQYNYVFFIHTDAMHARISHNLTYHFLIFINCSYIVPEYDIVNPTAYSAGGRHKRDLHFEERKKTVKFTAFGEDYDVSLEENTELLRSDLQAERHNADGTIDLVPVNRRCYYIGNLESHEISKVAVSTCNGMVRNKHGSYLLTQKTYTC